MAAAGRRPEALVEFALHASHSWKIRRGATGAANRARTTPAAGAAPVSVLGKIIGALIGLLLFRHPFGIIIGGFFGHLWDIGALRPQPLRSAASNSFIAPLFALAGAIAKSDG